MEGLKKLPLKTQLFRVQRMICVEAELDFGRHCKSNAGLVLIYLTSVHESILEDNRANSLGLSS
jgi:hypothetical protein